MLLGIIDFYLFYNYLIGNRWFLFVLSVFYLSLHKLWFHCTFASVFPQQWLGTCQLPQSTQLLQARTWSWHRPMARLHTRKLASSYNHWNWRCFIFPECAGKWTMERFMAFMRDTRAHSAVIINGKLKHVACSCVCVCIFPHAYVGPRAAPWHIYIYMYN